MDLVILAGGRGTRIKHLEKKVPKALIKFGNFSVLEYLLMHYSKYKFQKIYIISGYLGNQIYNKFHGKEYNLSKIEVIIEKNLKGTGGSLYELKKKIKSDFVLINGDTFFLIDINKFINFSLNQNTIISIALTKNNNYLSNKKLINLLLKNNLLKVTNKKTNIMNGGIYYLKKTLLSKIKNNYLSLEKKIEELTYKNKVSGKLYKNFFLDIGTEKNYKKAHRIIPKLFYKPAVFLDRDGVINEDTGYVSNFKKFKFRKNVIKGLIYLQKKGFYIFIVTNQAGIAKKKFKIDDFYKLQNKIYLYLLKFNFFFDDILYCPYHIKSKIKKFKKNSNLRKPGTGMINKLLKKFYINYEESLVIGDQKKDFLMAHKANLKFAYAENDFYKLIKKKVN